MRYNFKQNKKVICLAKVGPRTWDNKQNIFDIVCLDDAFNKVTGFEGHCNCASKAFTKNNIKSKQIVKICGETFEYVKSGGIHNYSIKPIKVKKASKEQKSFYESVQEIRKNFTGQERKKMLEEFTFSSYIN